MATKTIGTIALNIVAKTGALVNGLKKANRSVNKFGNGIKKTIKSIFSMKTAIVGLATALVAKFTGSMLKTVDALGKTASKLGINAEELQKLQFAANQTGTSVKTLNMGLQRQVRRISEAAKGTGEAAAALRELGINTEALNKLSPDKQFLKIADALKAVAVQGDRIRLTNKIFDTEGVSLVNTLRLGADAIKAFMGEAEKLGIILSEKEIKHAGKFVESWDKFAKVVKALTTKLLATLAPMMTVIIDKILAWAKETNAVGDTVETVFNFIIKGIDKVVKGWDTISLAVLRSKKLWIGFAGTVNELANYVVKFGQTVENVFSKSWKLASVTFEAIAAVITAAFNDPIGAIKKMFAELQIVTGKTMEALGRSMADMGVKGASVVLSAGQTTRLAGAIVLRGLRKDATSFASIVDEQAKKVATAFFDIFSDSTIGKGSEILSANVKRLRKDLASVNKEIADISKPKGDSPVLKFIKSMRDALTGGKDGEEKPEQKDPSGMTLTDHQTLAEKIRAVWNKYSDDTIKKQEVTTQMNTKGVLDSFVTITGAFSSHSKKMAKMNGILAITQTVINTAEAVMKTYGKYGMTPFGIAMAGAAVATGIAQIAKIRSAMSGGGGGAPASPGVAAPSAAADGGPSNQQSTQINVTYSGSNRTEEEIGRELIGKINLAIRDGAAIQGGGAGG